MVDSRRSKRPAVLGIWGFHPQRLLSRLSGHRGSAAALGIYVEAVEQFRAGSVGHGEGRTDAIRVDWRLVRDIADLLRLPVAAMRTRVLEHRRRHSKLAHADRVRRWEDSASGRNGVEHRWECAGDLERSRPSRGSRSYLRSGGGGVAEGLSLLSAI